MTDVDIIQKVQLVKGEFTTSEAAEIVDALITQKINFHKIKRLQNWEKEHDCDLGGLDCRLQELSRDKMSALEFIEQAKKEGYTVEINGSLDITFSRRSDAKNQQASKYN